MRRIIGLCLGLAASLITIVPSGWATKIEVSLTSVDVAVHEASVSGQGAYYTLGFDIPATVSTRNFYGATLVFYVDAASSEDLEELGPLLEVYALRSPFNGSVDSRQFVVPATTTAHVDKGLSKRVLFDISEIVELYLKNPGSNHGLIVGSLTGSRNGQFTVKGNVIGPNVLAKANFHYDGRVRK